MKIAVDAAVWLAAELLRAQRVPDAIAADVAEHLVEADRAGYASHGLSILPSYLRALRAGHVCGDAGPTQLFTYGNRLAFDGGRGFGQHVGKVAVRAAIEHAGAYGQCILTLRNSHHLGRMGHYGEMVARAGLVLLAFSNVIRRAPTVAPHGGAQARLTTNPLCFAGPLPGGRPPLLVDIATSAIAVYRARVLASTGHPAPAGALIDAAGRPTDDPATLFADPPGALLPFGGHKGYALGLVAELLAGVLSGGGTVRADYPPGGTPINNLFALVLDPQLDAECDWRSREVGAFFDYLLDCPPQPGVERVQYPGEYEAANRARHATHIELSDADWSALQTAAAESGVASGSVEIR